MIAQTARRGWRERERGGGTSASVVGVVHRTAESAVSEKIKRALRVLRTQDPHSGAPCRGTRCPGRPRSAPPSTCCLAAIGRPSRETHSTGGGSGSGAGDKRLGKKRR
jgi:hypothetical protein